MKVKVEAALGLEIQEEMDPFTVITTRGPENVIFAGGKFRHIFQFQKKTHQNMDGMVGKILSVFRILPCWPTLQQINLKKNNTKKYGYIRAWVW